MIDHGIWWGEFPLAPRQTGRWRVGPATLWIERQPGELRIATETETGAESTRVEVEVPARPRDVWEIEGATRHAISSGVSGIRIVPLLADRPVVTNPEKPIVVAAGSTITVYVSSPLWVGITPNGGANIEIPLLPPFETWFGPSPREGEICYASRNTFRLRLENLVRVPHRAFTAVHVENASDRSFPLQKMKLPVPFLELHHDSDGTLWTQDVVFEHTDSDSTSPVRLKDGAPSAARAPQQLAPPRRRISESVLARALTAWLSRDEGDR